MIASNIINLNLRLEIQNNYHLFLFHRKFHYIFFVCVYLGGGGSLLGVGFTSDSLVEHFTGSPEVEWTSGGFNVTSQSQVFQDLHWKPITNNLNTTLKHHLST